MKPEDLQAIKSILQPYATELEFGTLSLFAKVHDKHLFDIDAQKYHTTKLTNGNKEAAEMFIKLLKGLEVSLSQTGQEGNLSISVQLNDKGQATKLIVQNIDRYKVT